MKIQRLHVDNYIAFAVLMQSLLVVLQQVLIFVFKIPAESTTIYRVLLTAIPLSLAIVITLIRKWPIFLVVYVIASLILMLNIIVFPQNEQFLSILSTRFLLPIVIPSALCLMFISNIDVAENALYRISWLTTFLTLFYVLHFFRGTFEVEKYSMSFSYGLLLPLMTLYSKKSVYSLLAATFLFITILVIGSRGAAIVFLIYVVYDSLHSGKKSLISLLFLFIFFLTIPLLVQWLESMDIKSRTLNLFVIGDLYNTSGREYIYSKMMEIFWNNPLTGIGLFGDRFYLAGSYSHNLILELYLNWGLIGATLILIYFLSKTILTFIRSDKRNRLIVVKYFLAGVVPLTVSGSYLVDYDLGIYVGILFLISNDIKKKRLSIIKATHLSRINQSIQIK